MKISHSFWSAAILTGFLAASAAAGGLSEGPEQALLREKKQTEQLDGESRTPMEHAQDLLLQHEFAEAEKAFRILIKDDTTGDAYAGLLLALKMVPVEKFTRF